MINVPQVSLMPRKPPRKIAAKSRHLTNTRFSCPLHGEHIGRECPACREARRLAARTVEERRAAIGNKLERERARAHAGVLRMAIAVLKLHEEWTGVSICENLAADLEQGSLLEEGSL